MYVHEMQRELTARELSAAVRGRRSSDDDRAVAAAISEDCWRDVMESTPNDAPAQPGYRRREAVTA
jgi:hypothetical protein